MKVLKDLMRVLMVARVQNRREHTTVKSRTNQEKKLTNMYVYVYKEKRINEFHVIKTLETSSSSTWNIQSQLI